jgi:ribosomal protein L40E
MKTCSWCGKTNEDGAAFCAGCGRSLQSPPKTEVDPQLVDPALALVTVASFHNLTEAELLLGRLQTAGIEACIPEEYTTDVFSGVIPFELVTVRVAAKDLEDAKAVIAAGVEAGETAAASEPETASDAPDAAVKEPQTETIQNGKLCVSCRAPIREDARVCPKCGWTQPDAGK